MLSALLLLSLLQAGTPIACSNPGGVVEKHIQKGESVTVCFDFPADQESQIDYFRVRRSQTPAGSYDPMFKVPSADRGFTFTPDRLSNICVATVWSEIVDGVRIAHETPCSNHVTVWVEP